MPEFSGGPARLAAILGINPQKWPSKEFDMPRTQIDLKPWQDFRGKEEGILLHIHTSREAMMPVRDALDEFGKGQQTEPNYETGTFGLVGPSMVKIRNALVKNKKRWIFFGTFYDGLEKELKGKFLVIGFMRIDKIRDVRNLHIHKWMREEREDDVLSSYFDLDHCWALYSNEMKFFAPKDAFEVTQPLAKQWGATNGKLTRQTRLALDSTAVTQLREFFTSKTDMTEEYIATVREFQAYLKDDEEDEEA